MDLEAPEFGSNQIEMIGSVLLSLQSEVKKKIVDWATRLIIQMTSELLQTSRKLPVYKSERLQGDHYLDLDLDGTMESLYEDPRNKAEAVRVFKREKSGHSVLLILDTSFSMSGQKIVMAAAAAATVCHLFDSKDIAVIRFGTRGEILKRFDEDISAETLVERIFTIIPKGLTNIYQGLKMSLDELGVRKQAKYTAILLSDCDVNVGKTPGKIAWKLHGLKLITIPPENDFIANLIARETRGEVIPAKRVRDIPIILRRIFNTNK
jgi:Mg-chelatase subunit ChlD